MKKQRIDGQETRHELLEAASEVFAQKGFWEAKNTEICKKAHTNSASINYHFGSKENLYVQAWMFSFNKSLEKYPIDGNVPAQADGTERLYGVILSLMKRVADPENYDLDIFHKEIANPTGLLDETIFKAMQPFDQILTDVIRLLLGEQADNRQISLCHMSIRSQCFGPMLRRRHTLINPNLHKQHPDHPLEKLQIEELAKHILNFSLAGINNLRNGYQAQPMH